MGDITTKSYKFKKIITIYLISNQNAKINSNSHGLRY